MWGSGMYLTMRRKCLFVTSPHHSSIHQPTYSIDFQPSICMHPSIIHPFIFIQHLRSHPLISSSIAINRPTAPSVRSSIILIRHPSIHPRDILSIPSFSFHIIIHPFIYVYVLCVCLCSEVWCNIHGRILTSWLSQLLPTRSPSLVYISSCLHARTFLLSRFRPQRIPSPR